MHTSDTVQEKLSLYARFGVSIYFGAPGKRIPAYRGIPLQRKNGITMDEETLLAEANKWELAHGGLSEEQHSSLLIICLENRNNMYA